jgi:serine/threonine protein kinase
MLSTLQSIHNSRIFHADLKLENLLVDKSGCIRFADFGFAEPFVPGINFKGMKGTLNYMSP